MAGQRSITILGSTGSIGTQALSIAADYPQLFSVAALSAHSNAQLLFEQVRQFRPQMAALTGQAQPIPEDLRFCDWRFGPQALVDLAAQAPAEDVLVAVTGMVGLRCVLAARQHGRRVLLANKEALVAGGQLVMGCCPQLEDGPSLIPVDSEHSAIYQCLQGAQGNAFSLLTLTASGGPFRTWAAQDIRRATPEQALRHPNWSMGAKITIDSASMFNKALEVVEARWLFDASPEQIEVLIHPESIVHSMVSYEDGAVLAQLGLPDMRIPIQYAMAYPRRKSVAMPALDLAAIGALHFERPDPARFPALPLTYDALRAGGAAACMLSAANEVAVAAFLKHQLPFGGIYDTVAGTLDSLGNQKADTLEAVEQADQLARQAAARLIAAYPGR